MQHEHLSGLRTLTGFCLVLAFFSLGACGGGGGGSGAPEPVNAASERPAGLATAPPLQVDPNPEPQPGVTRAENASPSSVMLVAPANTSASASGSTTLSSSNTVDAGTSAPAPVTDSTTGVIALAPTPSPLESSPDRNSQVQVVPTPSFAAGAWSTPSPARSAELAPALISRLAPATVFAFASPNVTYPSRGMGIQCQGVNDSLVRINEVRVTTASADQVFRFGNAHAHSAATTPPLALKFSVGATDQVPSTWPPRCEMLAYPTASTGLPLNTPFWFAFSAWIDDWSQTSDEQLIAQWHQNDPRLNLNPFVAFVVRAGVLTVELRSSSTDLATKANTQLVLSQPISIKPKQWTQFVVRASLSPPNSSQSTFEMWQDNLKKVDYQGPLGFALQSGSYAYAKVGIYKWLNGNPWDLAAPVREIMVGSMVLAADPSRALLPSSLGAALDLR